MGWDRSSGINGKLPALRFPISLQLRGDELAERRHASRRRLTAKRRVLLSPLSVSISQLVRGKVCPANWLIRFARDERESADPRKRTRWMGWNMVTRTRRDSSNESWIVLRGKERLRDMHSSLASRAIFAQLNIYVTSAQDGDAFVWMRRVPFTFRWSLCLKNVWFGKIGAIFKGANDQINSKKKRRRSFPFRAPPSSI